MHVFWCQFLVSMTLFVKDIKLAFLVHACDQLLAAIFAVQICLEPEYVSKFEFMEYHLKNTICLVIAVFLSAYYSRKFTGKMYRKVTNKLYKHLKYFIYYFSSEMTEV